MSTPVNTSSTDSQMHNNIMAAGSKDRPPMLGPGRYSQWRSRFLRYIDTKANGEYLRKCIFDGPYKLTSVVIEAVAATVNAPAVPEHDEAETVHNMSEENKLYFKAEKEAIFLLLTGIGDEIYSTVDACNTANEMWTAIERLQQGESLNIQDVKTNLFWEFGKFTSREGESMESYYPRFYKLMNELTRNNLQVTTMQVNVQFLQQLQPDMDPLRFCDGFNDIRAERIAKSDNPLSTSLLAANHTQIIYYQATKNFKEQITTSFHNDQKQVMARGTRRRDLMNRNCEHITIFHAKIQEVLPADSRSIDLPLEQISSLTEKGETLHEYYLRFTLLLNDMNIYKMPLEQFQVNTKFLNTLPDEWSKFITDVKLVKDLHTTNVDQLHAYCLNQLKDMQMKFGETKLLILLEQQEKYPPGASEGKHGETTKLFCYNCKGEGHIAKQCTKPKRKRDETWFNDKVLLVQAQASGQALTEEEIAFLAIRTSDIQNLSDTNGSDALTEVLNPDNLTYDLFNQSEQIMTSSEQSNDVSQSETEITEMASAENNTSGPVPQCLNDVCSHQFRPRSSSNDF
ncbi:hypothetical protein Tco_0349039 [Tanacetum coccineum]